MADLFTLFPKLPVEMRLKIWGCTPVSPRVVEIKSYGSDDQHSLCPPPSVLKACKEARDEVLKQYVKICGKQIVLINPSIDTLFISLPDPKYFNDFVELGLRCLAIDGWWLEDMIESGKIDYLHSLAKLRTVETITNVLCTMADDPHTGDEKLASPETDLELTEKDQVWGRVIDFFRAGKKDITGWNPAVVCAVVKRETESKWAMVNSHLTN